MLCDKLIEAKKKCGLTNQQISEQSGVPIGTVNRVFSGAAYDLKFQTLQQLAPVLNISLDTLEIKAPAIISQPVEQEHQHHCPHDAQHKLLVSKLEETIADLRKVRRILFVSLLGTMAAFILLATINIIGVIF
jgi:transcriptional regulator with XRE-family HTH domain